MTKTLVVMAAGMGSRFGGPKQIEAVGPTGEFIIDYSVYDAKRAGFDNVVFVIKEEMEAIFKKTIGKRLANKINVSYAFQKLDDVPENKKYLVASRVKPWGTLQAVLCAKDYVKGDFIVINADDFYSFKAFQEASEFLDNNHNLNEFASINYPVVTTSSKYGSVKRGICLTDNDKITKIIESKVTFFPDYALAEPLSGEESFKIKLDTPVAVNMFIFKNNFFQYVEEYFKEYFKNSDDYILNNEILLPTLIKELLENKDIVLYNILSKGTWLGMTYKEDLPELKANIKKLIADGIYPERLWN